MLQGGELIIAHAGQTRTFSPSADGFSSYWAAFYAGDALSCQNHDRCNLTHSCISAGLTELHEPARLRGQHLVFV